MTPKSSTRKPPKRPLTLYIGSLNKSNFIVGFGDPTSSSTAQGSATVYIFTVDSGYRGHFQATVDKETQTLVFPADSEILSDKPMIRILLLPVHMIGPVDSRHRRDIFRAAVYAVGLDAGRHQIFLRNPEASEILPEGAEKAYHQPILAHNKKNGVYHPEFLHHPGKKLDRLRDHVEYLTIYLSPAYPGLPGAPRNLFFLVLATPDLTDSIYNFVLGSSDGLLGWSWVHQHKKFRFPFIPVGETDPLPMVELGRIRQ
ncbi:hypothetical protein BJY01DRAFT_256023 [Aspergillus pseudoustus]|uniref:Uncharacterized protein n=1 Tax=Aspergillus pseudoustus TaxID=1810923 RepID=A0ABR4IF29_9EURO